MPRKSIYLANPYGFSAQQRAGPLKDLVHALESLGLDVWEPFARNGQTGPCNAGSAYRTGQNDMNGVRDADALFAVLNGTPPDEGVMIELGMAIAWGKPTFLFRDDFRRCTDSGGYPLNLMIFAGLGEHDWTQSYYTDVTELPDPGKALVGFVNDESE